VRDRSDEEIALSDKVSTFAPLAPTASGAYFQILPAMDNGDVAI
jgi:hypothetical protein